MKIFENFWIWKTDELVLRLKNDLPINEGLYGLCFWLMYMVLPLFIDLSKNEHLQFQILESFIGLGIIYYLNYKGGNKNFLKKVICLFIPVTLRVIALGLIVKILINIIFSEASTRLSVENYWYYLMNIIIFGLLGLYVTKTINNQGPIKN